MSLISFFLFFNVITLNAETGNDLKENLRRAKKGDYIVTAQNKTYTLLHIYDKQEESLIIEEITVPVSKIKLKNFSWKQWTSLGAPSHTSWVMYSINLANGQMKEYFSFTKNSWFDIAKADNFLSTLLNLRLTPIPLKERKKVGPPPTDSSHDWRSIWQPKMVVDGKLIEGVAFDAWKTQWPKDGSELSGRTIEVFVPQENDKYPSYFPYWLQISGMIGKAKIRIIDSGSNLASPRPSLEMLKKPSNV